MSPAPTSTVVLPLPGGPTVSARWLRDRCTCERCRAGTTHERLLDPDTVVAGGSAEVELDGDALRCRFDDGHVGIVPVDLLELDLARRDRPDPLRGRRCWNLDEPAPFAEFAGPSLDDPARMLELLDRLHLDGAVVVTGAGHDLDAVEAVAGRIGQVLPSNYGRTWEIDATVAPSSAVDSTRALAVHTDLPYRATPPGLQVLLVATTEVAGGASTFADGFALAERLRAEDPDGWALLTTVPFTYDYVRDGVRFHSAWPLIGLDPGGAYSMIRRAPDLVGVPLVDTDRADAVYDALRRWNALLDDPSSQVTRALASGELVIFDNHRLLHGRTGFELGAAGRRRLLGCYLEADEATNRRNVLRARLHGIDPIGVHS